MAEKDEKSDKKESTKLNLKIPNQKEKSSKSPENKKILVGNKRERSKTSENEEEQEQDQEKKIINCSFKFCNYCKNINALEILEFDETTKNQTIIDYISKIITNSNFIKNIKDNIEYIFKNKDNNKKKNKNIICSQCFLNNFISGGLEKIFFKKKDDKDDNNIQNKYLDLNENEQKNNLKQIFDIYSINLNLAIKSLKDLKTKYSKTIKSTNDVFKNTAIRIMFSNFKENFQELKKKMDDCEKNLNEIEDIFDNIINDLTQKEEMKKFFIEGVFSNDNICKNNLLKILKKVENEIEIGTIKICNGPKSINNEINKNTEASEVIINNMDKIDNKENLNNKNNNNNQNNTQNIINNNTLLNLQNQKKQNNNEQLLLNNIDKAEMLKNNILLTQNNFDPTCTNSDFFLNPGLSFFPNIPPQGGRIPSNILINNLFPSQNLNPQLISQFNNSQIDSIFPNNNNNNNTNNNVNNNNSNTNLSKESNNNINNLNSINNLNGLSNITYPGILPRVNFPFNNPNETFKDFDNIFPMRNLMNNNQNNIINNLYNAQINPNSISLSPLPILQLTHHPYYPLI